MCNLCEVFGLSIGSLFHSRDQIADASKLDTDLQSSADAPGNASAATLLPLLGSAQSGYYFSGNIDIDATLIGSKWTFLNQTFSFPTLGSSYGDYYGHGENLYLVPFNSQQQGAVRYALNLVASYTPLTFTEISEFSSPATHRFANTNLSSIRSASGYFPTNTNEAGDVWFGLTNQPYYLTPAPGNWGQATIMHEIGHSLGLKHGHQDYTFLDLSSDLDVPSPRYGSKALPASHDGQSWSLMTYTGAQFAFSDEPQTYMQNDIAALQYMYGANYSANSSDTRYTWSTITGQMSINGVGQAVPTANKIYQTIWDGGGIDTYDLSNYSTGLLIDLNPGAFSTFSFSQRASLSQGNVGNALLYGGDARSYIENATCGSANDSLTGNAIANLLIGNGGDDFLYGQDGDDTLIGNSGADVMFGGNGSDTFVFSSGDVGGNDAIDGGEGVDALYVNGSVDFSSVRLVNFETLVFAGSGNSTAQFFHMENFFGRDVKIIRTVVGNDAFNVFRVDVAANSSYSAENLVFSQWSQGTDSILINGASGAESITGTRLADTINGSAGNDTILSKGGADIVDGGDGDDVFVYAAGEFLPGETAVGGSGTDEFRIDGDNYFNTGSVALEVLRYTNAAIASFRLDQLTSQIVIIGDTHLNQLMVSGSGVISVGGFTLNSWDDAADRIILLGSSGMDTLFGASGGDILTGGAGADVLLGGAGNDVFRYEAGDMAAGEVVDGQGGTNALHVIGAQDFSAGRVVDVQNVVFTGLVASSAIFDNTEAAYISSVAGDANVNTFRVNVASNASYSASGVAFSGWTQGVDSVGIFGASGNETLTGSNVADQIEGQAGNDIIAGGAGADVLDGGADNDVVSGGAGADVLLGGAGNDVFRYEAGDMATGEVVDGQGGTNALHVIGAQDFSAGRVVNVQNVVFTGLVASSAIFDNTEAAYISSMTGDANVNTFRVNVASNASYSASGVAFSGWTQGVDSVGIFGASGNETLIGSNVADMIDGKQGNDRILGGAGQDTFIYAGGEGNDQIGDFSGVGLAVGDVISLHNVGFSSFAQLLSTAYDVADGCTIVFDSMNMLTVIGVTKAQLDASDFLFV